MPSGRYWDVLGDDVTDVVHGAVRRRAELKLDERRAVAFDHRAADLVDPRHSTDRGFDALRDLRLHFVRGGAGLGHRHDRRREIDVRGVVHLHPGERNQARQHQAGEENDGEDRVANAPGRDVAKIHNSNFFLAAQRAASRRGFTFCPGLRNGPADSTTASPPLKSLRDRHPFIGDRSNLDAAPFDLVLRVDDIDVIAVVVAQHRALREQRRRRGSGRDAGLGESAGTHRRR